MGRVVKLSCLRCAHDYEVPEGSPLDGATCPKCGAARADNFIQAKFVRFESAAHPAHERAVAHARLGEIDAALDGVAEALRDGFDPEFLRNDPALAKVRADPRFAALFRRTP